MYTRESVSNLTAKLGLVELLAGYGVHLKKSGRVMKALSPFSDEKTPSFVVYPGENRFKCFSTGKSGDCIQYVREIEGCSFAEALEMLAEKFDVELQYESKEHEEARSKKMDLISQCELAQKQYQQAFSGSPAEAYAKTRQWDTVADKFGLGYGKVLSKEHLPLLESAGIYDEEKGFQFMQDRIVFPVRTRTGVCIGFSGRKLPDSLQKAKYINGRETDLYDKSKTLYGLFEGRLAIVRADHGYLVEGNSDVVSMHVAEIENCVAACGTSITKHHVSQCLGLTKNWTIAMDGDQAGKKAARTVSGLFLDAGTLPKVAMYGEGQDPGNTASGGKMNCIEVDAFEFIQGHEGLTSEYFDLLVNFLQKIPNIHYRDYLTATFAARHGISFAKHKKHCKPKQKYTVVEGPLPKRLRESWEEK